METTETTKHKAAIMEVLYGEEPVSTLSTKTLRWLDSVLPNNDKMGEFKSFRPNHDGNSAKEIYKLTEGFESLLAKKIITGRKTSSKVSTTVEYLMNNLEPNELAIVLHSYLEMAEKQMISSEIMKKIMKGGLGGLLNGEE